MHSLSKSLKFDKNRIRKCLAKVKLKFFQDIMSKLYQTFQSPYSLHKPPYTILFHTSYLPQWVCCQISKNIFFSSESSSAETLFWQLFFDSLTDSCSFLLKKYLIVVNHSNITLSLNHFIMYIYCWRRN